MIPLHYVTSAAAAGAAMGRAFAAAAGITTDSDPRLDPVRGDEIDELVNAQLARGRTDKL